MTITSYPHQPYKRLALGHSLLVGILFLLSYPFLSLARGQTTNPIVATVNGKVISQRDVDDSVIGQIYSLEQQLFALRKAALNNLITMRLIEAEAERQNLSVEQLKERWMSGLVTVDQLQIEDLYHKNRAAFGLMSADEAKEKLRFDLESQVRLSRYRDQMSNLRRQSKVEVLLEEPHLRLVNKPSTAPTKGAPNAKVVITEFSDFQCPYCKDVQAHLDRILERYPNDVRLEFKHLPLEIHPLANTSARAAYCAGKQKAFWKFHDALFDASDLSAEKIMSVARRLDLDVDQFTVCLASQESQNSIMVDVQEARRLGINGTPSFIINGKLLQGATSLEEFDAAIAVKLIASPSKTSTSPK